MQDDTSFEKRPEPPRRRSTMLELDRYSLTVFDSEGYALGTRWFKLCKTCWSLIPEQRMNAHKHYHKVIEDFMKKEGKKK